MHFLIGKNMIKWMVWVGYREDNLSGAGQFYWKGFFEPLE
jgi:hypothetical protein